MNSEELVATELNKFSALLKKCRDETASAQGVIAVDKFNRRLHHIKVANSLLRCIVKFAEEIDDTKNKLLEACSSDMAAVNKLDIVKKNVEPVIFPITQIPKLQTGTQFSKWEEVPAKRTRKAFSTSQKKIQITDNTFVYAEEITGISKVVTPGTLYYIPQKRTFAVLLCGNIFCGNMGIIYNKNGEFHKVKECDHYQESCTRSCTYFHDPLKVDWSSDIMNFTSNSFIFMPGGKSSAHYRRIGSRNSLEYDVKLTGQSDINHLGRQIIHELICWLVMKNYNKR